MKRRDAGEGRGAVSSGAPDAKKAADGGAAASDPRKARRKEPQAAAAVAVERLRFAVVCSSNMNRSMEAHKFLKKNGYDVESYGTGSCVKLPGPSIDRPNVFKFGGTTYEQIMKDLKAKDPSLYKQNGVLAMLDRNKRIKLAPEKFQTATAERFHVVITCESRIFDEVLRDLEDRETSSNEPVHVINVEIKDNHECATIGAQHIVKLAALLQAAEDLDDEIQNILEQFESETGQSVLHATAYY